MEISSVLILAIDWFANILNIVVFIRCILSWFPIGYGNPIIQLLYTLTEPVLAPIRNIINKSPLGGRGMMIDFSPIIALFFVEIVKNILIVIISYLPF